ncbi:MAG TPA: hypothetical protein VK440_05920 [Burkholderiales bacterium]|nr:hypothetical protein [Burkholderiales bacterium]
MVDDIKESRHKRLQAMSQHRSKALSLYACSVIFVLLGHPARAENPPDPTRPPMVVEGPPSSGAFASSLVLQSVFISPRLKVAIINGEPVKLGDSYGSAKVVKISESGVVLDTDGKLQTLKLFPSVEKKPPQLEEASSTSKKKLPNSERNPEKSKEQ